MALAGEGSEKARLRALVRGRVQGVGFRDFAWHHARSLELTGWVRNLGDGSTVEVVAEGPRRALEQLLEQLRRGPGAARVEGVEAQWGIALDEFHSFQVRYR